MYTEKTLSLLIMFPLRNSDNARKVKTDIVYTYAVFGGGGFALEH
jgi:hypothetical protein